MKKVVLIILAVVGSFAAIGFGVFTLVSTLTSGLVDTARSFTDAVEAGDVPAAYGTFSGALKIQVDEPELEAMLENIGVLGTSGDVSFPSRSFQNNTGQVTGSFTSDEGVVFPLKIDLVKEAEAWRIIGFRYGADG